MRRCGLTTNPRATPNGRVAARRFVHGWARLACWIPPCSVAPPLPQPQNLKLLAMQSKTNSRGGAAMPAMPAMPRAGHWKQGARASGLRSASWATVHSQRTGLRWRVGMHRVDASQRNSQTERQSMGESVGASVGAGVGASARVEQGCICDGW